MNDRDSDYLNHTLDRVKPLCLTAIQTMREALDDAERAVNRIDTAPEDIVARVVHYASWGYANMSGQIESAIVAIGDARKVAMAKLTEAS